MILTTHFAWIWRVCRNAGCRSRGDSRSQIEGGLGSGSTLRLRPRSTGAQRGQAGGIEIRRGGKFVAAKGVCSKRRWETQRKLCRYLDAAIDSFQGLERRKQSAGAGAGAGAEKVGCRTGKRRG